MEHRYSEGPADGSRRLPHIIRVWGARVGAAIQARNRRFNTFVAAILTIALVCGSLTRVPAAEASISGQGLIILSSTSSQFSPGSQIYASGRIAFETGCSAGSTDTFFAASDVWFVPQGGVDTAPGSAMPVDLEGADGKLTSFIITSMTATFEEELLAVVGPWMRGPMDIVLDHCQDGKFDYGQDYILTNSMRVGQGTVPNGELINLPDAIKFKFRERAELCSRVRDAVIVGGGTILVLLGLIALTFVSPPAGLGLAAILLPLLFGAMASGAELCRRNYDLLYNDPPDPQFEQLALLPEVRLPDASSADAVLAATQDLAVAVGYEGAAAEMLLHSLERYQGAQLAGRPDWQLVHARAMRQEIALLHDLIARSDGSASSYGTTIAADARPFDSTAAQLEAARVRFVAGNLTADEQRELLNLGLDETRIEQARQWLAGTDFAITKAELHTIATDFPASGLGLSGELSALDEQLDALIARLMANPYVGDAGPIAEAGGPYSGTAGTPLSLDGAASTSPVQVTAYTWDLDGDGAFDDATGATPSFTPSRAFQGVIGLKVTNRYGLESVDYAAIGVGAGNGSPSFTSLSDGPAAARIITGASWSFSAAATDPDGDAVQLDWLLDGTPVASGPSFTYAPADAALGPHRLEVVASNPGATAGSRSHAWLFAVVKPDADGDGWRANRDCDDNDSGVNPGQSEVIGNGKDDDCDERTSDAGGAPVALFSFESDGRNVALFEGGASVHSFSSQLSTSNTPQHMIDAGSADSGWAAASGKLTNEWAIIALAEGKTYQIDRVKLQPGSGNNGVKSFTVAVATQSAQGPYTTVLTGTVASGSPLQEFALPEPVQARWVKFTGLNTQSTSANQLVVKQFKVYTSQEGPRTVTFRNRSVDPEDSIAGYAWDFGDGQTSTAQHPTHTFPEAAATYPVKLTVTDAQGNTATHTMPYRVLLPPTVNFTYTPVAPNEAQTVSFTVSGSDPDGGTLAGPRVWVWNDTTSAQSFSANSATHTFFNSGAYTVKLQVMDSQEQLSTVERTITIANVPPTITAFDTNKTIFWGQDIGLKTVAPTDVSITDSNNLTCDWAWGDGATTRIANCNDTKARAPHSYADPGSYTASLTLTDPDGGSATRSLVVTVQRRALAPQFLSLRTLADGRVEATARLYDSFSWQPLANRTLTFALGSSTALATTGADGTATVFLSPSAGAEQATVSVAGDSHYTAGSAERALDAPRGDIIFIIDESGSMGDDQDAVEQNLTTMAAQLATQLDFRIGLVGFGAGVNHEGATISSQGHIHLPLTPDIGAATRELRDFIAYGNLELGFDGVRAAMSDPMGFRERAGVCAVIITDDKSYIASSAPTTQAQALDALRQRGATFFGVVNLGLSATRAQYGMDPGSLAAETGGQVWDIKSFRTDPEPVLDALLSTCIARIVRPDLSLSVSDGQTTARQGDTLQYTLTVNNVSTGNASNVALSDTLPAGVSFVSASDGGTLANGRVSWPVFDLAAGQSATRTMTIRLDGQLATGTALVNSASVADDGANGTDPTPANNSASDTTMIEAPLNTAPVAQDQAGSTPEDTAAQIVLGASDADGDALSYTIVAQPQHGELSGTAPDLVYTPDANYHGPDSFTFRANDGTLASNLATVGIAVTPVNDAPTADAGPDQTVIAGTAVALDGSGSSDLDGDGLSFAWAQAGGPSATLTGANTATPQFTPAAAGSYSFTLSVSDGTASAQDSVTITVEPQPNQAPAAQDDAATTAEETPLVVDVLANDSDADGDALRVTAVGAAANGTVELITDGADAGKLRYTPAVAYTGPDSFTYTLDDGNGATAQATVTITVTPLNDAPVVTAGADQAVDEGGSVTVSASFTDEERAAQQYSCEVAWGDGSSTEGTVVAPSATQPGSCAASHTYADDDPSGTPSDTYAVSVTITDSGMPAASGSATLGVTVSNVAPTIGGIVAPTGPVSLGSAVEARISLADVGAQDSHSCTIAWGDGASESVQASGGTCVATRTYAGPGVYTIAVTVTDDDGGSATERHQYVVIYDPNGGFVTGGGWFTSPAGACQLTTLCGDATGRANFGFVARYKKGATVPEGQTEFQFRAGDLNFHSSRYEWLVVAGSRAQYKGEGTINGQGSYGFMVTAVDAGNRGGDTFRIKLWELASGATVYDNQMGAGDDAEPTTTIEGGSITIHK